MNLPDELERAVVLAGVDVAEGAGLSRAERRRRSRAYAQAWVELLRSGYEIPPGPRLHLAGLFEYLVRGIVPGPIADCASPGRPVGPSEERDLRHAVTYVLAAKRGLIDDKTPIETVRVAYNSKGRSNVHNWVKQYAATIDVAALADDPDAIKDRMIEAGRRYAAEGRRQVSEK
jgi:hypothetical protein